MARTPPQGTEVRLTPRPSQGDSCGIGSSAKRLTTRIEPRNTRHASPSGLGRNWRNLFPSLSPWFVNLDSEPCTPPARTLRRKQGDQCPRAPMGNPGNAPLIFLAFNINPEGVAAVLPGAPANNQ